MKFEDYFIKRINSVRTAAADPLKHISIITKDFLSQYRSCKGPWDYLLKMEVTHNWAIGIYEFTDADGTLVIVLDKNNATPKFHGGYSRIFSLCLQGHFKNDLSPEENKDVAEMTRAIRLIAERLVFLNSSINTVFEEKAYLLDVTKLTIEPDTAILYVIHKDRESREDDAIGLAYFKELAKLREIKDGE